MYHPCPSAAPVHECRPWGGRPMHRRSWHHRTESAPCVDVRDRGWGHRSVGLRSLRLAAVVSAIALLAGCGQSHHAAPRSVGTPGPEPASNLAKTTTTTTVVIRDLVAATANNVFALTGQCATNPGAPCDVSSVAGPPESVAFAQKMAGLAKRGLKVRLMPASHLVIDSVSVDAAATQATVGVCEVDANVVYTPGAGPGAQDVIYNNAVSTYHETWSFHLDPPGGSRWKLYMSTRTDQSSGSACAPAP